MRKVNLVYLLKKENPKSIEEFFNTEQSKEFDDTTIDLDISRYLEIKKI